MASGKGRTMAAAEFEEVEAIFHSALTKRPDEIAAFLETACGRDQLLRDQVATLLASHQRAGGFIETSGAALTLRIVEEQRDKELLGQTVGHYKISERIGAGGMGEVYLATDITAGREAALKFLPTRFTGDPERLRRFQQEARALVGLNHPNIVTVYEVGVDGAHQYIASELITGETLRQRLTRGPMVAKEAVDVAIQLGDALAAAHAAGVVHRDVKPENIMLRADGYVKVLDFGIAKLAEPEAPLTMEKEAVAGLFHTHLGSIIGTIRYMSPEQALGRSVDQRTDIWGAGAILYEMVTARAPFSGELPPEVVKSILESEPSPLTNHAGETSMELQEIVSRALRKEPAARFQSAHELVEALKAVRRKMEFAGELERSTPSLMKRLRLPIAALALVVASLSLALSFRSFRSRPPAPIAEKSIAVLPFENFSEDKENAYFAAGIQDDVLTSLAQIHELKVISRTSVMAYQKPGGRNMRQISQALGVANVLEGSVRRTGNRVLVNVQLIDARNDRHIWAERYDRAVADSIGLQGELATQIATALKAKLAPEEKARLDVRPTTNSAAYVLYLTGLGLEATLHRPPGATIAAEQLYMQATALDPGFALAYARASLLNSGMTGDDRAFKAKARAQAEEALRLSPTLGEAHMALGLCLYWGEKNYDAALKEFEVAAATSPNNAEIHQYVAGIYRRQGRWRESVASFERALSLDPRNGRIAFHAGNNYLFVRDWASATACYNRALEIAPDSVSPKIGLAFLEVFRNENPATGRKILQHIPASLDPSGFLTLARWDLAMLERDYATAEKILADLEDLPSAADAPKTFYQGRTALARGDIKSAQRYFSAAAPAIEAGVRDHPDVVEHRTQLALLYAYMQRKEDAVRESRRAVELEPESQNAFHGAACAANLALVYVLTGEQDQAITLIERLLSTPGAVGSGMDSASNITLVDLRLRWEWDPLRSNARFQKIVAGPEPKTVY